MYHGDIRLGETLDIKFTTVSTAGVPTQLAGSPVISAYVGNGTTEITAGITLSVDFDGRTGLNNVRVVASSGNGFATATNVQLVITTGTVSGGSVVGYVVGTFSIEARSAVMPTAAARTLTIESDGMAHADVKEWLGVAPLALSSQRVQSVDTNSANLDAAISTRATPAQVNTEVDTALADVNLDHLVGTAASIPAIPAGTYIDQMMDDGTAVYDRTTDSLQAIRDSGGGAPTVGQIADAVWDEAIAGHLAAGSTGLALNSAGSAGDPWNTAVPGAYGAGTAGKILGDNLNATVSSRSSHSAADVWAVATRTLSAAGVQAIWDALTSALTTAGSIGKLLVDNINATISSRSSHTAADIWAVATRILTAGTNIVLAKGTGVTGFNDLSATQVNAEVVDALAVDTYAEPGQGASAATTTLAAKINYLFKAWRNRKTQTASQFSLYNDAAAVIDQKASFSDDTVTADVGEISSGP